ncbi:MAG: hypothetical protein WDM76_18490 [Limisphaerales bacterium]
MLFKKVILSAFIIFLLACDSFALGQIQYVENAKSKGSFPIVQGKVAANIYVDANDFAGVIRAAGDLQKDIVRVTSLIPKITHEEMLPAKMSSSLAQSEKARLLINSFAKRKLTFRKLPANGNRF